MNDDILFHYTNLESLVRIFSEPNIIRLRFSEFSRLNDPLERCYCYQELNMDEETTNNDTDHFFVFSLTTKADDLEMWRMYANDAKGVAVGFFRNELTKIRQNPNKQDGTIHLCKCYYGKEQMDRMRDDINRMDEDMKIEFVHDASCLFKHTCYRYEDEYRLLFKSTITRNDTYSRIVKFGRNIVSNIIIGPKSDITEQELNNIINFSTISKSKLPYR